MKWGNKTYLTEFWVTVESSEAVTHDSGDARLLEDLDSTRL
jgi:hypothetical protein